MRGKGGSRSASDFVSHLIAFDSIAPPNRGISGRGLRIAHDKGYYHSYCGEAEREPFGHTSRLEPQPRGAVTRRAAAQRRSRAGGLTRPLAEAIYDSAWTVLQIGRTAFLVEKRE